MNWKQNVLAVAAFTLVALSGYSQPAPSGAQPPKGSSTTGTGASSQTSTSSSASTSTPSRTATLLGLIYRVNLGEIEMANLAKQNSNSAPVKDFADQIIKDSKSTEEKVAAFASSHNIDLATVAQQMRAMRDQAAKRAKETAMDEREAREVGSATGEYAWMSEPDKSSSGVMQLLANHESEMQKLGTLKGAAFDREFAKAMVSDHQAVIDRLTTARTRVNDPEAVALVDKLLPMAKQHLTMAQKLQETVAKSS